MELFQDISNQQQQQQPVLKTFERRRKLTAVSEEPEPASPASSTASPSGSSIASTTPGDASTAGPTTAATSGLPKHGRRSSVLLRGAALPGHQLFSSSAATTSRSLLLSRMSKARRKAYLAYTQQMAEYFAEVDQFELIEESPDAAATEKKARSKLPPGVQPTPLVWPQLRQRRSTRSQAATAATDTPAEHQALQSATPGSAVYSTRSRSTATAVSQASDASLLASPQPASPSLSSPPPPSADADADSPGVSPSLHATATPAAAAPASASQQQQQLESRRRPSHVPQEQQQQEEECSTATACDDLVSGTPLQQQQEEDSVSLNSSSSGSGRQNWLPSISSSLAGLSLTADTPATHVVAGKAAGADAANAELLPAAASPSPPPSEQQQHGIQQSSNSDSTSLAATTPAAADASTAQQADMKQLLHQMQELWAAVTPEAAPANNAAPAEEEEEVSAQQQQEEQEQEEQALAADLIADTPAAKARGDKQAKKQQQKAKQQKPKQKPKAATAAAGSTDEPDAEVLRQQEEEQQQLAEQHYQAWLQKQAEEAAVAELQHLELQATAAAELTPLQQMLKACGQPVEVSVIPPMRTFLEDVMDLRDVVKIGEGTYGEAFKSGQVVLKFVPMEGSNLVNGWPQKGAGDLLGEAVIALTLSDLGRQHDDDTGAPHASYTDAFVHTHRVGVCQGPYPPAFIKAWKAWDKRHKSENDPIAGLPDGQLYAVFAMANCGRDLEGYQLQGYDQVRSMMLQTALALAVAEEAVAFEHRDLHWGNIMLSPPHDTHVSARLKGVAIRVRTEGARVRLIDFTASRLQTPGGDVVFCDLEGEDGLFDGPKGKPQFETYRRMRKLTCKDWTGSHPGTNVLWLLYLTELLLSSEKPVPGATAAQKRCLREFKKRLAGYRCCSEVIWDELFEGLWAVV